MKLYLKQKVFTWGDKFTVYDENGNDRYYVEGEVLTWGKKLHLTNLSGRELAFIKQKITFFLPQYSIIRNSTEIAKVIREFTFFSQEYTVNGFGWTVKGDFLAHEYEILQCGHTVVTVSKEWFTWGDAYRIETAPGVDVVNALAVVLVIDACLESNS